MRKSKGTSYQTRGTYSFSGSRKIKLGSKGEEAQLAGEGTGQKASVRKGGFLHYSFGEYWIPPKYC